MDKEEWTRKNFVAPCAGHQFKDIAHIYSFVTTFTGSDIYRSRREPVRGPKQVRDCALI
jgi:hypothetical protein